MSRTCLETITGLISSLDLAVGDRLPGERDLAVRMGCSRNTVREALVALAAQGRIEIRGRSGCYLAASVEAESWKTLREETGSAAVLEVMQVLGPHVAAVAATRCGPTDARRLEAMTARLGRFLLNRDAVPTAREFAAFFVALSEIAGNPYFERLIREATQARVLLKGLKAMDKAGIETFFALHVSLMQALQNRDSRRAATQARHCLDAFGALMGGAQAEGRHIRERVA